jgi:magnesium-transporting ATPase (P-type)
MDREDYLTREQLEELTRRMQQRRQTEDIDYIESLEGQDGLLRRLKTDLNTGISSDSIPLRVQLFGANHIRLPSPQSIFSLWKQAFFNIYDIVFTVAGLISLMLTSFNRPAFNEWSWLEGLVLVAHSFGRCLFWAVTEQKKQSDFNEMRSQEHRLKRVRVLRDGVEQTISQADVVCHVSSRYLLYFDTCTACPGTQVLLSNS